MLTIKNLVVQKENKEILKNVSLELEKSRIYILMGPNGSGKSSLAKVISGDPSFDVESGQVILDSTDLLEMKPADRTLAGVFVSYQHPPEIPGLNIAQYLRQIYNKKHETNLSPSEFSEILTEKLTLLNLDENFRNRYLNEGFSGGEKKKMEILQMLMLEPKIAILDEIDSGVDIDALKTITAVINSQVEEKQTTVLFITHYPSILNHVDPYKIFLMKEGQIVKEGQEDLIKRVQEEGYAKF